MIELHSQDISIELSIVWKKTNSKILDKCNLSYNPYLKITYNNLSDSPLYFLNAYETDTEIPVFPRNHSLNNDSFFNFQDSTYSHLRHFVIIGAGASFKTHAWSVTADTINFEEEHELSSINDELSSVYDRLFGTDSTRNNWCKDDTFNYSAVDINGNNISYHLQNNFVFLNPEQKQSFFYNLIGFQILGGRYCFMLATNTINDFVFTNPIWSEQQKKWIFNQTYLPTNINEYILYHGNFYSNKIEIGF